MSGGNFFGETDGQLTRTMLFIHVNSIAGRFHSNQDMVAMEPIVSNSAKKMFELFDQCFQMLKLAGFTAKTLTTDNHRVNQKFISVKLNDELEIYAWCDQVQIAKNMYYNFLNKKTLLCLTSRP